MKRKAGSVAYVLLLLLILAFAVHHRYSGPEYDQPGYVTYEIDYSDYPQHY